MNSLSEDRPIYNLKAVVNKTGIKPDTLRAWERRYGIPEPDRSQSGHRLYTQRDIKTLEWLLERVDEGLSISRAVALWNDLREAGEDPVRQGSARPQQAAATHNTLPTVHQGGMLDELSNQWVSACLAYDERDAEQALSNAFAMFPVDIVVTGIIQRGIAAIGQAWYQGRVTVQQEHFATELAMRRIESLMASAPPPSRAGRIIVACPAHEEHTFAPLTLSLLLRRRGWDVVYLGANVPVQSLELTVRTLAPNLVVLIAQQLQTAANLLESAEAIERTGIPIAYGGSIFVGNPKLSDFVPGHLLGNELLDAVNAVEQLMHAPVQKPARRILPSEYVRAVQQFRSRRSQIEADTWQDLSSSSVDRRKLADSMSALGDNIVAALALGDFGILDKGSDSLEFVTDSDRSLSAETTESLLRSFGRACRRYLDEDAEMVVRWIESVVDIEEEFSHVVAPQNGQGRTSNARIDDRRHRIDWSIAQPEPDSRRTQRNGTHA